MNYKYQFVLLQLFILVLLAASGCKKFLEEKPLDSLAIPTTLKDYQSLLDKYSSINEVDASSGEVSAAETYLSDADYNARDEVDRRMYTWQNSNIFISQNNDWSNVYGKNFTLNTVIEGLPKVEKTALNSMEWNSVMGQAHFIKARNLLQAAGIWCLAYDESTADTEPGLPVIDGTNFNLRSTRSTLRETYNDIINEFKLAAALLPNQEIHVMRPSKPAAFALLARTYLWMRKYEQAQLYADSCLKIKSSLLDYNSLTATASYPFPQFNTEVLYAAVFKSLTTIAAARAKIVPEVYSLYDPKDLRKTLYFKDNGNGTYAFKGSYDNSVTAFSGVAIDEVYLTRAECAARLNQTGLALSDLNALLVTRYAKGFYVPYTGLSGEVLVQIILKERRKQLLIRGLRWMDVKRLNKEGAGISLSRTVNNITYNLPANSRRFALPIPEEVITLSDIVQNTY
ncbi:RagB/SusD family nutrient uptake outer membrane protein [Pedobacter sp. BMA]|uniref:RagB/SusD family nutrient uptake outer membrane protein n=1 Tax=Pedobacter sp. BMA TaxID=1663685 RepID=UPI000A8BF3EF|nr:RagB/SusD family nutrient uptake outer membrane protein [Pedobacter sp. BMA]